jgi:hypothetical protein
MENAIQVTLEEGQTIMGQIQEAFGFTKYDFENVDGEKRLIYTKWGTGADQIDVENLGDRSLKINGDLGDIYIDKIRTDGWVIVGKGTTLHCPDIEAGEDIVTEYEGYIH